MAGVQAQLLPAAQISLWARVRDLRIAHIEGALGERTLVRASCMRRTLFLVPAEHLAIFVRGTARRAEKEIRWAHGKGVPDRVVDAAIDAALDVLDQPLTRPEIASALTLRSLGHYQNASSPPSGKRRVILAASSEPLRWTFRLAETSNPYRTRHRAGNLHGDVMFAGFVDFGEPRSTYR
jgi:hypothetical protein